MFEAMDVREVESELVGMAGHLAAGTCRFLLLLAEFDGRDGWAGPGLRSCAHWLNWRIGMDTRTARDHLRVAHALTALPAVIAAFAAGRVSYSKVRALTRIATPDSEQMLLQVAQHGTAAQLDRLVAAARAGGDPRPAPARRGLWWRREGDGSLTIRLRVPAEDGERLLAAVQAELDATELDATELDATELDGAELDGAELDGPGAGTLPDLDRETFDGADRPTGSGSAEPDRDGSAEPPAAAVGDAAVGDAAVGDAAVGDAAVGNAGATAPGWEAARDERRARAAEHAPGPTLDPAAARRVDALLHLLDRRGPDGGETAAATVVVHLRADQAWLDASGTPVPATTAERLACHGAVQTLLTGSDGIPLRLGRTRRTATRAQIRALRARDGHTCAFPGCDAARHLQAHHVIWWRANGRTDLDNLVLICGFHHRLVHDHGYRIEAAAPGRFTYSRPDGTPVPAAAPPPAGSADDLLARHTAQAIDGWTITPDWGGERLDLDPILATLHHQRVAA